MNSLYIEDNFSDVINYNALLLYFSNYNFNKVKVMLQKL